MKLRKTIICALCMAACGDKRENASPVVSKDSAGVHVVESSSSRWTTNTSWRIDSVPDIRIGVTDGDPNASFGKIVGAVQLDSGLIVIADQQSGDLRFFDSSGKFLYARGGMGEGPGESSYLVALSECSPNTAYAFDQQLRKVLIRSAAGDLLREVPLAEGEKERFPYKYACGGGKFVVMGWGDLTPQASLTNATFYSQDAPVWLADADGKIEKKLGSFRQSERLFVPNAKKTGGSTGPHPLGRSTLLDITDSAVYVGTEDRLEVRLYSYAGVLKAVYRGPPRDSAVQKNLIDQYRSAALDDEDASNRKFVEMSGWLMPNRLPAYTRMIIDEGENIWLRSFSPLTSAPRSWEVFGRTGEYLGSVEMPRDIIPTQIGLNSLLGIHTDSLGVQTVVRHRIQR